MCDKRKEQAGRMTVVGYRKLAILKGKTLMSLAD